MSNTVREKNPKAIKQLIAKLSRPIVVRVGIQGSEASRMYEGVSVADIAAIHEFGLGNNPVRSWLRAWFDENEQRLAEDLRRGYRRVIAGDINAETLANAFGLRAVTSIQERISAGISPPLHPETIRRKGSSTPLIDTGVLRSSVTFVLESGEMVGGFIP